MGLTGIQIITAAVASFLVGFSKTGLTGLGVLIVPMMASIFPAKESTGALLPMLILGDLFAVAYYRQHAQWNILAKLLPWILPGLILGYFALKGVTSDVLAPALGVMVILLIALQLARERGGEWLEQQLPRAWWFSAVMGILAGFTTMVGNVAGALMGIYLLSMGLKKNEFMGTGAWYYLIVNVAKVPFSVHLGLITPASLKFNLAASPVIVLGAVVGILTFRLIPQRLFNHAILAIAALAALRLLWI